jgi:phospholipase/carboxylesterase
MSTLLAVQNGERVTSSLTADGLVVVFHGYGADRTNLYDVAEGLSLHNPKLRFIIPNGIARFEGGGNGFQWFSLRDYTKQAMQRGLADVAPKIADWVKLRLKELDLTEDKLSLVGFSQGAMLSLYLAASGMLSPNKVISYSGLFIPPAIPDRNEKNTDIIAFHGDSDQVLPCDMTQASYMLLDQYGLKKFNFTRERGVEHYITQPSIESGGRFLQSI